MVHPERRLGQERLGGCPFRPQVHGGRRDPQGGRVIPGPFLPTSSSSSSSRGGLTTAPSTSGSAELLGNPSRAGGGHSTYGRFIRMFAESLARASQEYIERCANNCGRARVMGLDICDPCAAENAEAVAREESSEDYWEWVTR